MNKKTGIDLISKERNEQIEKHGYTTSKDSKYKNNELIKASASIIATGEKDFPFDVESYGKIMKKPYLQRLAIAGALISAEIDRVLLESEKQNETKGKATKKA